MKEIEIIEKGDWSVGVMPSTCAVLSISEPFALALVEDGTLEKFKDELTKLVCKYYEPEYYTETIDNVK